MSKYKSCSEIEAGMHFYHDRINFCCVDHNPGKGFVKIIDYTGGPLPLDLIEQSRNRLRELNQTDEDSPCKGCPKLELKEWNENTAKVNLLAIGNYSLCNLECSYCYRNSCEKDYLKELATPKYDIMQPLNDLISADLLEKEFTIMWAGGEPTLYREFEKIHELFYDTGYILNSYIYSNCVKYSESIANGLKSGNFKLNCSVDSGTSDTYKKIKKRNYHDRVWSNLENYVKANPENVFLKYILIEDNCGQEEIEAFINNCISIGVQNIIITRDVFSIDTTKEVISQNILDGFAQLAKRAIENNIKYLIDEVALPEYEKARYKLKLLSISESLVSENRGGNNDFKIDGIESKYSEILSRMYAYKNKLDEVEKGISKPDESSAAPKTAIIENDENILLGNQAFKNHDYTAALEFFRKALSNDPTNAVIFYYIGNAYWALRDMDNCINNYMQAHELDPLNKEYVLICCEILLNHDYLIEAKQILFRHLSLTLEDGNMQSIVKRIFSKEEEIINSMETEEIVPG